MITRKTPHAAGPAPRKPTAAGAAPHAPGGPATAGTREPAARLTSNQGVPMADNQNSLRPGDRGPTLLEDFLLREKITHFDHERIPERVVHARGSGAHGVFVCTRDCSEWTRAAFLGSVGRSTPVFARFSTVAGGAGSSDTPRDVRGFAVKFYTSEGNFDLVGNNVPVFFIQDAIKFPDLVHALKMEPDRGYPQASSAHDTFWDFISLMPESLHMLMWAMSDRTLPRSIRLIDGFGVHTFRMVNDSGRSIFVKFHWRAELGVASTTWDEAVQTAGADPDHHRRDLREAIERGDHPSWSLGLQLIDESTAASLPFDVLDPTKLVPEESVPVQIVGRMTLNANPDNFFAETEQVAFCPAHLVPGIDFSDDPLLQGRLFSYTDTQLSRLGSPNFHLLPVNRPRCPFGNFQRDAMMRIDTPAGRVNYEPNSLWPDGPKEVGPHGFTSAAVEVSGRKHRQRPSSFADHYSQARLFFRSQSVPERRHIAAALAFELGRLQVQAIRQRMLGHLEVIAPELASDVASRLGLEPADYEPAHPQVSPIDLPLAPSLSAATTRMPGLPAKRVAILAGPGSDAGRLQSLEKALQKAGASVALVAWEPGPLRLSDGASLEPHLTLAAAPSCLFDAVAVVLSEARALTLATQAAATTWLRDAWRHLKAIALDEGGRLLAAQAALPTDDAVLPLATRADVPRFLAAIARGPCFDREGQAGTDP